MVYELDREKFEDMLGDMLSEEDDTPLLESVQEYVLEDGCPTENDDFLKMKVYEAYLIFLDLSKTYYQNKVKALQNNTRVSID